MILINPNTLFIGQKVHFLEQCESTNNHAQKLILKNNTIEGETVICGNQTAGKGQSGNVWMSEGHKNLTFSVILSPQNLDVRNNFYLNIITSLALYKSLTLLLPGECVEIKWPNDLLVNKLKIAGILIENSISANRFKSTVIGIGLNVNQTSFGDLNATSLSKVCGHEFKLESVLELCLQNLEKYYMELKSGKQADLKAEYLNSLYGFHEFFGFTYKNEKYEGKISDLLPDGKLFIASNHNNEKLEVGFKEIQFILT